MLKRMRRSAVVVVVLGLLAVKPAWAACGADGGVPAVGYRVDAEGASVGDGG